MPVLFTEEIIAKLKHLKEDSGYNYIGIDCSIGKIYELEKEMTEVLSEEDYIDLFDDLIFSVLKQLGKINGYEINSEIITNEILCDIRSNIISHVADVTDYSINLAPKKYLKLGDRFKLDNDTYLIIKENKGYNILNINSHCVFFIDTSFKNIADMMSYIKDTYGDYSTIG